MAVDHALVPVLVDLIGQCDDVALFEAQLPVILGLKIVQRLAAGLVEMSCKGSQGTTVRPYLPYIQAPGLAPAQPPPAPEIPLFSMSEPPNLNPRIAIEACWALSYFCSIIFAN